MKKLFDFLTPQGDNYYFPSGNYSATGPGIAALMVLVSGFLVGLIYNALLLIIPFIYLNFLLPIGAALVGGYLVKIISKLCLIRNYAARKYLAIGFSIIVFYVQWFAYAVFYSTDEIIFIAAIKENLGLLFNPFAISSIAIEINKIGPWSVFGLHFNGILLSLIWLVETLILLIVPALFVNNTPILPFSETLLRWYPKLTLKHEFGYLSTVNLFKKNLEISLEFALQELGKSDAFRYSKISVFYLKDAEKQYLFIENVFIENRGKGTKNTKPALLFYEISAQNALDLIEKYDAKRDYFIY